MKHIKLLVDDNIIKYDPDCNLKVLHKGMTEPVRLAFDFSEEWTGRPKVVAFCNLSGKEYPPLVLKDGKNCIIPTEVLTNPAFKVQILGKDQNGTFRTTFCTIYLEGGNV